MKSLSRRTSSPTNRDDPVHTALVKARRARKKGQTRREVNALRQACALAEFNAELWTLLAVACLRMERVEEGLEALRHALWLRQRAGDERKALVTRRLLASASKGLGLDRSAA